MLFKKYPELKQHAAHCKSYTKLTRSGALIEKWELVDGTWHNVTELERAKARLAALQAELDAMDEPENKAVFF